MTQQHTPGPWRSDGTHYNICIRGPNGRNVARVYGKFKDAKTDANTRLILAAPTMLDLLEGFVGSGVEWDGPTNRYVTMQVDRDRLTDAKALIEHIKA